MYGLDKSWHDNTCISLWLAGQPNWKVSKHKTTSYIHPLNQVHIVVTEVLTWSLVCLLQSLKMFPVFLIPKLYKV